MEICSIGFTHKSASEFFGLLNANHIERLLDVRLNNTSQLAGFAKHSDLPYFLKEICGASYVHEPLLTPTPEILEEYRKNKENWEKFLTNYRALIRSRKVESALSKKDFQQRTVLLCGEASAEHCHRKVALDYLKAKWGGITILHL